MRLIDLKNSDIETAARAVAAALQRPGAVVLSPTETVYGLIARASDTAAYEKIYELKHRFGSKRLGWFVGDWHSLDRFGITMTAVARRLAERYCPGAITLIVPAPEAFGGSIGFRVPDYPLLARVLDLVDEPLWQTSANLSGCPDAPSAAAALAQLAGEVDFAIEAGELPPGVLASTVVDARGETPVVLRQGALEIQ